MTTHTLEQEKHSDFLKQERIDPITGDILQEGDNVVICASCKSAFLVDSWSYMDYKHCNQTHTLREIPRQEAVKIDRESRTERLDKLAFFQFRTVKQSEITSIYTGFFALIGAIASYFSYLLNMNFILVGVAAVLVGIGIGKKMYKQKQLILDSGHFIINNGQKNELIEGVDVKTISTEKDTFFSFLANSILFNKEEDFYHLVITTKDNKTHRFFIAEREKRRIEEATNILKKYATPNHSQIPVQNIPPSLDNTNNRLDLGS
ncbi:hypothetical protein WAF17_20565 [Bernardetia sp. ABR2-2B]|uniref:hypothetical protein n=1 Tax=Bernardetia sp. ABR2-2B TaxID=3127472 RepID=UPI0030CCE813